MPGQGLYYNTLTGTWRAKNCDVDSYGVTNKTYGLSPAACRDCPSGQVATTAPGYPNSASYFVNNSDGTYGFISVKACVNKPGVCVCWLQPRSMNGNSHTSGNPVGTCLIVWHVLPSFLSQDRGSHTCSWESVSVHTLRNCLTSYSTSIQPS